MTQKPKTVFVIGAGFTRAFLPQAPLLTDNYDIDSLLKKFETLPHARRILELELAKNSDKKINIERLMSRLDSRMPYDFEHGANEELSLLLKEVKFSFNIRLDAAKKGQFFSTELAAFSKYCVHKNITCISFNYDDVFDQTLWEYKKIVDLGQPPYWHPDGGYGFFCRPSASCIRDTAAFMDKTSMLLLKLHGSTNWRIRRGYGRPHVIDAVVHHELWLPQHRNMESDQELIELHLEPESFIVPPVMVKSTLVEQPILKLIWSIAYRELERAEKVVFIGYSLPKTDMASSFLFSEALRNIKVSDVQIVNLAFDESQKKALRETYREVLPGIKNEQFDFRGALDWSKEIVLTDAT